MNKNVSNQSFLVLNNQRGASSWDLVLKLLSITLVSLFAFSSGVWFGKKLSDSDYQRQALEGEFDKETKKMASAEHGSGKESEAVSEEDVQAATEKALTNEKEGEEGAGHGEGRSVASTHEEGHKDEHATAHGEAKHEAPVREAKAEHGTAHSEAKAEHAAAAPAHEVKHETAAHHEEPAHKADAHEVAKKPDLSAAVVAAHRVASNASPIEKEQPKPESRVPNSLPKTVGVSGDFAFTVQIASYPTAAAAKEHVDSMSKKGIPAFDVEATVNGKTWHRVSVGSFKTFKEASEYRTKLQQQADLPAAVVAKMTK